MPITAERRAEIDRLLMSRPQAGQPAPQAPQPSPQIAPQAPTGGSGLTPERRAQIDAMLANRPQAPAPQPAQKAPNILQSMAKPFLRGATNALNFAEGAGKLLQGDVAGAQQSTSRARDFGALGHDIRPVGVSEQGEFKNTGDFAKDVIGTGAEIGSYLAPAAIGVGSKVVKGGAVGANLTRNIARPTIGAFTKGGMLAGGLGSFGAGLQEDQSFGKTLAQTAGGVGLGGLVGGAIPLAGGAISKIAKLGGNIGNELFGKTSGAGAAAFKTLGEKPEATMGFTRRAAREGVDTVKNEALEAARDGYRAIKKEASDEYVGRLAEITKNQKPFDNELQTIRQTTLDSLQAKGVKFNEGRKLNNLNFERTRLGRNGDVVEGAFNELMNWKDTTAKGLDELKKNLDDWRDVFSSTEKGTPAYKAVDEMFRSVRSTLENNVQGYKEMTSRYHLLADATKEIEDALSLKQGAKTDTTLRKLMSTMRQDNELRLSMLRRVQEASGVDIESMIAGATLSPWTPRGLAGVASGIIGPTGVTLSVINPSNIPALLLYLGISSPRLLAEGIAIAKKITTIKNPLILKRRFMNLLIQATREAATSSGNGQGTGQKP